MEGRIIMKKVLSLILAVALCLTLCACGEPADTQGQPTQNQPATNPTVTPTEPVAQPTAPTDPVDDPTEPTQSVDTSTEPTEPRPDLTCTHEYGQWIVTQEATCEEKGSRVRICAWCTYAQVEEVKEKGHTTQSGTCERCEKWIGDQPQQSVRDIIEVYEVYVSDIDYAGGVDMGIAFTNTSDKTIKYIHFYVRPYNAVGDSLSCDIRGYSNFDAYVTGPLEPGYEGYHRYGDDGYAANSWSECWYNYDVSYIELYGIYIEYMDGTTYRLYSDEVAEAFAEYPVDPNVDHLGYETGFSYDSKNERFDFQLSLNNRHSVYLCRDAYVDIRIQNDDGVVVFDHTYRVDATDFEEKNSDYFGSSAVATIHIPISLLLNTDDNYGRLYYRVYSADGTWEFPEEYETSFDLPQREWADFYAEVTGFAYYQCYTTFTAENGNVLVIEDYDYSSENGYSYGNKVTVTLTGRKLSGVDQYYTTFSGKVLNEKGNTVKTFSTNLKNLKAGDTFTYSISLGDVADGNYYVLLDGMYTDANGLIYSLSADGSGYYAVITQNCTGELVIPSTYDGKPVIGLQPYQYPNGNHYVALTITSVHIPASVSYIEPGIFAYCDTLRSIVVHASNPYYSSKQNCLIETASKTLVSGCATSVIPADGSVTQFGYLAFAGLKNLTSLEIPEGIVHIGYNTFEDCTSLKSVTIPASTTSLDWYVFADCTSLESVQVRGDLTYIGYGSFKNCCHLQNFQMPDTVTEVEDGAFIGCVSLLEVEDGICYVGKWAVGYEGSIHTAAFRQGTVGVASSAFGACPTLKEVVIPESCVYVGYFAFENCPELRRVEIQGNQLVFGFNLFGGCERLKDIYFAGTAAQWNQIEKNDDWHTGEVRIHCSDATEHYSNIKAQSSYLTWTHVSSSADQWKFYTPYIEDNMLYIDFYSVTFQASVIWKDDKNTGMIMGEASGTEGFYSIVPLTAQYEQKINDAGVGQRILVKISLDELGEDRPEQLYLRFYAYINGQLQTINCNLTMEW